MDNGLLIIAHTPLASALRQGVAHVFPEQAKSLRVLDVQAADPIEASLKSGRALLATFGREKNFLLLTDIMGATPCNLATRLAQEAGEQARVVAGVNLPMLLRAVTYQALPLEELLPIVLTGGVQGIVEVSSSAIDEKGKT